MVCLDLVVRESCWGFEDVKLACLPYWSLGVLETPLKPLFAQSEGICPCTCMLDLEPTRPYFLPPWIQFQLLGKKKAWVLGQVDHATGVNLSKPHCPPHVCFICNVGIGLDFPKLHTVLACEGDWWLPSFVVHLGFALTSCSYPGPIRPRRPTVLEEGSQTIESMTRALPLTGLSVLTALPVLNRASGVT